MALDLSLGQRVDSRSYLVDQMHQFEIINQEWVNGPLMLEKSKVYQEMMEKHVYRVQPNDFLNAPNRYKLDG